MSGVVGFDDIFVSQYLNPPLTTVHVNIEEVGRRAAELLLKKMQTTNNIPGSVVHIPTELIIRESCLIMSKFITKYGHFSDDGNEYIINTHYTPKPWINVISNGD